MMTSIMSPTPPEGYQILRQIGEGRSKVYLAQGPRADLHVALKYVDPKTEAIDEERRGCTFQQILFALAPEQVRITECQGWKGNWIIYGFVEGQELSKTPEASRCKSIIVKRLLEGVRLFARAGIMHRDLRPENIMVNHWDQDCEDIQVTFLDFGSAIGGMGKSISPEDPDVNFKGRRALPYAWTPPEVRNSKPLERFKPYECITDLREYGSYDIWGVGSIAFWLSHSSDSSCAFDRCLALDAYACASGLAHGIADSASCSYAQTSVEDILAEEDSATKIMLTTEPCCRPTAEALLGGGDSLVVQNNIEACSQFQMSARSIAKIMSENKTAVLTERQAVEPSINKRKRTENATQMNVLHVHPKKSHARTSPSSIIS